MNQKSENNAQQNTIIAFKDADQAGIGNKARHLARLMLCQPSLFAVPNGLVLLPDFSWAQDVTQLNNMLPNIGKGPFAVRSCGLNEDGANESMAGKFETKLNISEEGLAAAIQAVRESFGDDMSTSAVLIQQMITPDYAGVMFTRSPENAALASCEFSEGMADAVVSGTVEPTRVDYGRWTGALYPDSSEFNAMLQHLFLVGMTIEDKMGEAQDIEWAYDAKAEKLYILQSRGITSQLYEPCIAKEQDAVAKLAYHNKAAGKGQIVFENSAVREVVYAPTRLTRSLISKLYSPEGSLGAALALLKLPSPKIAQPYVSSLFGQLYANVEVERKLFGFSAKRLWANLKLKRKLSKDPKMLLGWLEKTVTSLPQYPVQLKNLDDDVQIQAKAVVAGVKVFVEEVYPIAYAATILAQMADENDGQGSLTSKLMSDLSRLHHTHDVDLFLQAWGERSANDYELAEPRFCEAPDAAKVYAENYAHFPWDDVAMGDGFLFYKELAKDKAVRWLYVLRQNCLLLQHTLGLEAGLIFNLDLNDIQAISEGHLNKETVRQLCMSHAKDEAEFAHVHLGHEVALDTIERLEPLAGDAQGLKGKMVSVKTAFQGTVRHVNTLDERPLAEGEILLTQHLTPELVGHFHQSIGCVSDMGGALSHAAIVARELGYPVLVLPKSSEIIHDGDTIDVRADGSLTMTRQIPRL